MGRNSSPEKKIIDVNKNKQNKLKNLGFLPEKLVKTPPIMLIKK